MNKKELVQRGQKMLEDFHKRSSQGKVSSMMPINDYQVGKFVEEEMDDISSLNKTIEQLKLELEGLKNTRKHSPSQNPNSIKIMLDDLSLQLQESHPALFKQIENKFCELYAVIKSQKAHIDSWKENEIDLAISEEKNRLEEWEASIGEKQMRIETLEADKQILDEHLAVRNTEIDNKDQELKTKTNLIDDLIAKNHRLQHLQQENQLKLANQIAECTQLSHNLSHSASQCKRVEEFIHKKMEYACKLQASASSTIHLKNCRLTNGDNLDSKLRFIWESKEVEFQRKLGSHCKLLGSFKQQHLLFKNHIVQNILPEYEKYLNSAVCKINLRVNDMAFKDLEKEKEFNNEMESLSSNNRILEEKILLFCDMDKEKNKKIDNNEKSVIRYKKEIEDLQSAINCLTNEKRLLKCESDSQESENKELNEEIDKLKLELEKSKLNENSTLHKSDELQSEVLSLKNTIGNLIEEKQTEQKISSSNNDKISHLNEVINQYKTETETLKQSQLQFSHVIQQNLIDLQDILEVISTEVVSQLFEPPSEADTVSQNSFNISKALILDGDKYEQAMQSKLLTLKGSIKSLVAEKEKMKKQLYSLEIQAKFVEKESIEKDEYFSSICTELRKNIEVLNNTVRNLTDDKQLLQKDVYTQENVVKNLQEKIHSCKSEKIKTKRNEDSLAQECKRMQKKIDALSDSISNLNSEKMATQKEFSSQTSIIKQLRLEIDELHALEHDSREKLESAMQDLVEVRSCLECSKKEVSSLHKQKGIIEAEKLEKENVLQKKISELSESHKILEEENLLLCEMDKEKNLIIEDHEKVNEDLQNNCDELQKTVANLTGNVESLVKEKKTAMDNLLLKKNTVEQLEEAAHKHHDLEIELKQSQEALQKSVKDLNRENEILNRALTELKELTSTQEKSILILSERNKQLLLDESESKSLQEECSSQKDTILKLSEEKKQLKEMLDAVKHEKTVEISNLEQAQRKLDLLQCSITELREENMRTKEELDQTQREKSETLIEKDKELKQRQEKIFSLQVSSSSEREIYSKLEKESKELYTSLQNDKSELEIKLIKQNEDLERLIQEKNKIEEDALVKIQLSDRSIQEKTHDLQLQKEQEICRIQEEYEKELKAEISKKKTLHNELDVRIKEMQLAQTRILSEQQKVGELLSKIIQFSRNMYEGVLVVKDEKHDEEFYLESFTNGSLLTQLKSLFAKQERMQELANRLDALTPSKVSASPRLPSGDPFRRIEVAVINLTKEIRTNEARIGKQVSSIVNSTLREFGNSNLNSSSHSSLNSSVTNTALSENMMIIQKYYDFVMNQIFSYLTQEINDAEIREEVFKHKHPMSVEFVDLELERKVFSEILHMKDEHKRIRNHQHCLESLLKEKEECLSSQQAHFETKQEILEKKLSGVYREVISRLLCFAQQLDIEQDNDLNINQFTINKALQLLERTLNQQHFYLIKHVHQLHRMLIPSPSNDPTETPLEVSITQIISAIEQKSQQASYFHQKLQEMLSVQQQENLWQNGCKRLAHHLHLQCTQRSTKNPITVEEFTSETAHYVAKLREHASTRDSIEIEKKKWEDSFRNNQNENKELKLIIERQETHQKQELLNHQREFELLQNQLRKGQEENELQVNSLIEKNKQLDLLVKEKENIISKQRQVASNEFSTEKIDSKEKQKKVNISLQNRLTRRELEIAQLNDHISELIDASSDLKRKLMKYERRIKHEQKKYERLENQLMETQIESKKVSKHAVKMEHQLQEMHSAVHVLSQSS